MYPLQILELLIGFIVNDEYNFKPVTGKSHDWKQWVAIIDLKTCVICKSNNGKIYGIDEHMDDIVPAHPFCRCIIEIMNTIEAGSATIDGLLGADYSLKNNSTLPDKYVLKRDAYKIGWSPFRGNLTKVAPGKSIGGDIYKNKESKLPEATGRIWYEADINYTSGYRNTHRILYSNDGLVFVTYDHYETFYEIVDGWE